MKVLQINCRSNGSTGNIAKSIHKRLLDCGEESYFAYGLGPDAGKNTFRISNQMDYRIHTYLGRLLGMHGAFSGLCTRSLIRKISYLQPDIVHLHNLHGDYINVPILMRYLKELNINLVITLHDCWLFTGGCAHYTVAGCNGWQNNCGKCTQLGVYPKSYLFDWTRRSLRNKKELLGGFTQLRITAVSKWLEGQARQSYLKQYPINTIYNGIDINVFRPYSGDVIRQKYAISSKKIVLGVASVWNDERKGLLHFFELANMLPSEYGIVLVGLTKSEIAQAPDNVVCIERTEDEHELAELYATADVFINLSEEETFGMVAAEALACGTPAVVSTKTACPEIIDERTGMAISTTDLDAVADAIVKVIENRSRTECRKRAVECFNKNDMIESYIKQYKSMLII